MKRPSLVALALGVLFIGTSELAAQDVMIGFRAGLINADVSEDDPDLDAESTSGIVAGGFLSIGIGDNFAIQPEILYAQKGFGVSEAGTSLEANLDYIEIPVLLKVRIGNPDQSVRPTIFAGGFYAFESGCSVTESTDGVSAELSCDTELDERKESDVGVLFGAGLDISVSEHLFVVLDARYGLGLQNLDDSADSDSIKSRTWSVSGGLAIGIG